MTSHLRPALSLLILLTLITGLLYPLAVTGLAQLVFPWQANGSVLARQGRAVGSALIGQNFTAPGYFWSRPSATATYPYNGLASGGSNLGPTNPALREAVRARIAALRAADPGNTAPVPVDLVTASASGLDPDISLAAARYQAARVARARHLPLGRVQALIDAQAHPRWLGLFGTPRVNVLELNLALDGTPPQRAERP
ncbi:MAG: potassium-transporting ATPase subunit KdpC [Thiomonas arsenitoxydans]|nr:potassium-transporting ATPase subunit KdpC [Thiomonas arsenitoxydans]